MMTLSDCNCNRYWRPISTAPLDGTVILLCVFRDNEYVMIDEGCWEFIETSDWDGKPIYGWTSNNGDMEEPTHWMPSFKPNVSSSPSESN